MMIVDRFTFLGMRAGTVYSKYEPQVFEPFCIKGETIFADGKPIDWFYQRLHDALNFDTLSRAEETGDRISLDFHCENRDGCFEPHQLFAVWDDNDVRSLIARLQETLPA